MALRTVLRHLSLLPKCRIILLLVFFLLSFTRGVGTKFLLIPSTSTELSLGVSPVIGLQTQFNPALIQEGRWYSASGGKWLADIPQSGFKVSGNLLNGKYAVLGRYMGMDDLELRSEIPTDDPIATYNAYGMALSGAYSYQLHQLAFGASLSLINFGIHSETSSGVAVNAGFLYSLNQGAQIGGSILNIGKMSDLNNVAPALPLRVLLGVKLNHSWQAWESNFAPSLDWIKGNDLSVHLAEEINWKSIGLMVGTEFQKDNFNVSGGFHFKTGAFRVGYGFRVGQNRIGTAQLVDISIRIR